jgi:hypothetical protein
MKTVIYDDWIGLRPNKYLVQEKGTTYSTSSSPYDLPDAVRAELGPGKNALAVEFKYIGAEPAGEKVTIDDTVFVVLGRNSHRLLRIGGLPSETVKLLDAVRGACVILSQRGSAHIPKENLSVTTRVVSDNADALVESARRHAKEAE